MLFQGKPSQTPALDNTVDRDLQPKTCLNILILTSLLNCLTISMSPILLWFFNNKVARYYSIIRRHCQWKRKPRWRRNSACTYPVVQWNTRWLQCDPLGGPVGTDRIAPDLQSSRSWIESG